MDDDRGAIKSSIPEAGVRLLRWARQSAYAFLEPLDYVSRVINGRSDFPPLRLRRYVGPLRSFEMSGAEFTAYLKLACGLRADESVLDIGSGCGLMALHLADYLSPEGSYAGVDIHRASIEWCRHTIGARLNNFTFEHIDVKSRAYNPRGRYDAGEYSFPFADRSFDLILLKSVFTHMRPAEVSNYIGEVSRLLSDKGRCLMTFFLLNERQAALSSEGLNKMDFAHGDETWRYVRPNSPESAVAYAEQHVHALLREHGLELSAPVMYGTWSGRRDGLSYQDMLLVRRGNG